MSKKVRDFSDLIQRGKFLSLHGLWSEMDLGERSFARGNLLKLSQETIDKMKKVLSSVNKSFYVELFEKKEESVEISVKDESPEMSGAALERFTILKRMLDSCNENPMLLDMVVKKLAIYPDINTILPVIKKIDESIYKKIFEELANPGSNSFDDDLFNGDVVDCDFVKEHTMRCKKKAKILGEYHRDLSKNGVIPQIIESLLMQESYNLDNEEFGIFDENFGFENHDEDEDSDED